MSGCDWPIWGLVPGAAEADGAGVESVVQAYAGWLAPRKRKAAAMTTTAEIPPMTTC